MNADEVKQRLLVDLQVAHALTDAAHPGGLTASKLLFCSSQAVRLLLLQQEGRSGDFYRGLRGKWMHDGLNDALGEVDPGFTDGRGKRYTWDPGGGLPVITGEFDFLLDGSPVEVKTRPRDECRWHADHGAAPEHAAQVSAAAAAVGASQAFVVYLPTDSGEDEVAVCEVDPHHWAREAAQWLHRVDVRHEVDGLIESGLSRERAVAQVLESVPREPPVGICLLLCPFVKACRGDYVPPAEVEIPDPLIREAVAEAARWRDIRLDAEKRERAAKAMITHAEGRVSTAEDTIEVRQQHVAGSGERRGHTKTVVTRRPS